MNQDNYIFTILNKIKWNFHIVFTYPFNYQRYINNQANKYRSDIFYNFFSRISSIFKMRRNKQIYAFTDETSSNGNGHLHALYKLPEKYQGTDQEFISTANRVWPLSLGIPPQLAGTINRPFISPICNESSNNKVLYVAKTISETDSPDFLSKEAKRIISTCNTFHENSARIQKCKEYPDQLLW
jgi:hypothetical protein